MQTVNAFAAQKRKEKLQLFQYELPDLSFVSTN